MAGQKRVQLLTTNKDQTKPVQTMTCYVTEKCTSTVHISADTASHAATKPEMSPPVNPDSGLPGFTAELITSGLVAS